MEKLKIAIIGTDRNGTEDDAILRTLDDPTILELCTPIISDTTEKAEKRPDATVLISANQPADATEIIVTEKVCFMPLAGEPTAEDIVKFRDILERDFDLRSPRIAIVQETNVGNPDLSSQVTTEFGINTYGPYTAEQILAEDKAHHFDGIVTADKNLTLHIIKELSQEAPVRYFASKETVVTAVYQPLHTDEETGELTNVTALTYPIYTAIDVIRNRAFYDEARQNPLPKLFRDKREDRKTEKDTPKNAE